MMKLIDYNGTSSLLIDNIERTENRIDFDVSVILYDKKTDTDIKFKTKSYIDIDEWKQKSEILLLQDKIELDNFSYYAKYDKTLYPWDPCKNITVQNYFDFSSSINNSRVKFMIETGNLFTKTLSKEIEDIIEFQPFFDNTVTTNPCSKDGLIHIELGIIEIRRTCTDSYTFDRCTLQLKVYSENYHIVRVFDDDDYERAMFMAKEIEQFNNGTLEQFDIVVEFLEMEFKWVDGKKMGKGTISDFTWPRPNELIFDEHIDIEWRYVDKKDLPLISEKFIPAEEFHVGSNPHCG